MAADRLPDEVEVALSIFCDVCAASLRPGAVNDDDICRHCPNLRRAILAAMCEERAFGIEQGEGLSQSLVKYWTDKFHARAAAIREGK